MLCLLLVGMVVFTFGEGGWFEFNHYDDPQWISENSKVQAGLSREGVHYAFNSNILGHWAPLTVLSHMAACQAFGTGAGAHHLVNVGLHAVGAVLLFLCLWKLTGAMWRSVVVAAFFAVHPLRAESVMWITERKDVLSGIFFFFTVLAYAGWARRGGALRYILVLTLFVCGLMSKSMLVTLPCVLVLLDFWPLGRITSRIGAVRCIAEKLPMFALVAVMSILQIRFVETFLTPVSQLGWSARIGNAVVSYAIYLGQLFWADDLAAFYPHPGVPPMWQIIVSAVALLTISGIVFRHGGTHRYLCVGWLWFLGMLFPVIGLIQPGEIARTDRYTYLPQLGLLIMVIWGLADLTRSWQRRRLLLSGAASIALLTAIITTRKQAATWRNDDTMWSHALAVTKDNHIAHNGLGCVELQKKNYPAAIAHFSEAARIQPRYWRAHANLGAAFLEAGDTQRAIQEADIALRMNTGETAMEFGRRFKSAGLLPAAALCFQKALEAHPRDEEAELELAFVRAKSGTLEEAVQSYQSVLKRHPDKLQALIELGQLFTRMGRIDEAVPLYEQALAQKSDDAIVLSALATARLKQGHSSTAVGLYRRALKSKPDLADAQANLAWLLATSVDDSLRNGKEAKEWARRANDGAGGSNPSILRILAASHAEAGEYVEAVATIEKALAIARPMGDANLIGRLGVQKELYLSNKPLRVPIQPAVTNH